MLEFKDAGSILRNLQKDFGFEPFMKCSVTVPPTISVLLDEKGTEVEGKVGPYNVGSTLVLTCDILGSDNLSKY